jgi:hypothetical protein
MADKSASGFRGNDITINRASETQCLDVQRGYLVPGGINTGTWLSRTGNLGTETVKIWPRVPWDSDPRKSALWSPASVEHYSTVISSKETSHVNSPVTVEK